MNVREALQMATSGLGRLEAQLLLMQVLPCARAYLITHDDTPLTPPQAARFHDWLAQRLDDVPLAYLVGHKEFHGLTLRVSPATLVPRPDTETLVDWALELLAANPLAQPRVLDLGTGSGAIALAIKHRCPRARVSAVDLSAPALDLARRNAHTLQLEIHFAQGSWFKPLVGQRFDLILSNPPYIAAHDAHLAALRHEPLCALTPGGDGLSDLQHLCQHAPAHLMPGAWLLLEHGFDQAPAVAKALHDSGFAKESTRLDLGRASALQRCHFSSINMPR